MKNLHKAIFKAFSFTFFSFASMAQSPKIHHFLRMPQPHTHYFEVQTDLSGISSFQQQGFIDIKMPVWTPGSYLIREYAKNVEGFEAYNGKQKLSAQKINKNTWRIMLNHAKNISFSYKVYAFELSVRTSFLDDTHGYLNPASVCMYIAKHTELPHKITIEPYTNWDTISTGLPAVSGKKNTFLAQNLDTFIDSPIVIGNQTVLNFEANHIPHRVAMIGTTTYNEKQLLTDLKKVCETATSVVGEHPCQDYTFLVEHSLQGSGGLEHLNSTTLHVSRSAYQKESSYQSFLSLVAHEYFHLWNIKRIRPATLGPFDYENENYTNLLYLSEGFTSFYQSYILRRAALMTEHEYLTTIAKEISSIENTPGDKVQSVAESSFDAWIKYYRQNENSRNSSVSYYDKGAVIGTVLNLLLLKETNGKKNLDDVFRSLWAEFYKTKKRGFTDVEFQETVNAVAGKNLNWFFEKHIYQTDPLPYTAVFEAVGIELTDENANNNEPFLGADTTLTNGKFRIKSILRDSPAYIYGLNVNDELITIDGEKINNNFAKIIAHKKPEQSIKIDIIRDGLPRSFDVKLSSNPLKKIKLVKKATISPAQEELYQKWLYVQ